MNSRSTRAIPQATLTLSKDQPELDVSFTAGAISAFGGLPLLEKIAQSTGLLDGAAALLTDHRTQSLIDHNNIKLLKQCVLLTATGNPDTNDADRFRYDPVLLVALGLDVDGVTAVLHLKRQFLDFSILSTLKASISSQIGFWSFTFGTRRSLSDSTCTPMEQQSKPLERRRGQSIAAASTAKRCIFR